MSPLSARFEIEILKNSSKCNFFFEILAEYNRKNAKISLFFLTLTTELRRLIYYKLKLGVYFRNTFQLVPFSTRCASEIKKDTIKTR